MIRDDEINRLIKYAQALNTTVKIKQKKKGDDDAGWVIDGSEIIIYTTSKTPKIDVVLSLIHEISHHLEHIHGNDRELDEKLDEAIEPDEEKKQHRRKLYDWELKGAQWWESVYKETDCKFNIRKLHAQMEYDLWQYEFYYEKGKFPNKKQKMEKRNTLKNKYKVTI